MRGDIHNTMSIADTVNIVLLGTAVIGIFLTVYQIRKGNQVQKATFFKELYLTVIADTDIREAIYLIDRNQFIFDQGFYDSPNEKSVDRLLCFADLICELCDRKLLTRQEMYFFKYMLIVSYQNDGIQAYLDDLRRFYKAIGTDTVPFASFVSYCEKELPNRVTLYSR